MGRCASIITSDGKAGKIALVILIAVNLFLNIYGNDWGLPYRWHSDEKVANVLHMANERTLIDPIGESLHPTGYHLFLLTFFAPAYAYLKLMNYPIASLKEAASVSWAHMATLFPDFATGIYMYARTLSAILGALTVYLIYLIGREIYDERTGIFSAAALSVSMGFIGINHFAKYQSLLNLLIALTILLCLKALKEGAPERSRRFLLLGFLSAGFAISVHINAPLLLLPLSLAFIFISPRAFDGFRGCILMSVGCVSLYLMGIILGTPSLLTNFNDYLARFGNKYEAGLTEMAVSEAMPIFVGPMNYFFELLAIYGMPLFVLILGGVVRSLLSLRKMRRKEAILFSFVLAYCFIMTILYSDKYPQTKHIIAVVPLLAVFGGMSMSGLFASGRIPKAGKYIFFSLIFLYSFAYSFKADMVFKEEDTRHKSTQWIIENIPRGSKIEVFDQLNYVASASIMNDYVIVYLGRNSKNFKGRRFFKWNEVDGREGYLERINEFDSTSDYIIVDLNDIDKLYLSDYMSHIPGLAEYMRSLFNGEKNFRVIKVFKPKNQKIESKRIKGLVYSENLLWDPIPSYRVTGNTIYIFKRIIDNGAKVKFK